MNITDAELARLEELAELYLSGNALPFAESDYRESACNAVPSLVSEVRALRRYSQMMRSGNKVVRDDLESENASLRGQVEALQKMVEWLANKLIGCPPEFTNCAVDCAECRIEAARRAVGCGR